MQTLNVLAEPRFAEGPVPGKVHAVKTDQLVGEAYFLKAKQTMGPVASPDADRVFFVLKGEGAASLATRPAQEFRLAPGTVFLVPRGTWLRVEAGSDLVLGHAAKFPFRLEEQTKA
jgi:quercetin dioxygenase-like cupin family protein